MCFAVSTFHLSTIYVLELYSRGIHRLLYSLVIDIFVTATVAASSFAHQIQLKDPLFFDQTPCMGTGLHACTYTRIHKYRLQYCHL